MNVRVLLDLTMTSISKVSLMRSYPYGLTIGIVVILGII